MCHVLSRCVINSRHSYHLLLLILPAWNAACHSYQRTYLSELAHIHPRLDCCWRGLALSTSRITSLFKNLSAYECDFKEYQIEEVGQRIYTRTIQLGSEILEKHFI